MTPLTIRIADDDSAWEATLTVDGRVRLREKATGIRTLAMTFGAAERFLEGVEQRNEQRSSPGL